MIRGGGVQVDRELAAALDAVPDPARDFSWPVEQDALSWATAMQGTIIRFRRTIFLTNAN